MHTKLHRALELILKQLFLKSPRLLKAITVMNQTLEGYTLRFWKTIFRPKYIDVVQSVQSYRVYRYLAISAKHFSVAYTAVDIENITRWREDMNFIFEGQNNILGTDH